MSSIIKRNYVPGTFETLSGIALEQVTGTNWTYFVLDTFFKFEVATIELRANTVIGTVLVLGTDYELVSDVFYTKLEAKYTGAQLFGMFRIINPIYQNVDLFFSGKNYGTMIDNEAVKAYIDVGTSYEKYKTYDVITSGVPLVAYQTALADASISQIELDLPLVIAGATQWYGVSLCCNSNHCGITTSGGQLVNGLDTHISLATIQSTVIFKANGIDGWDIVSDTRIYRRPVPITDNTSLLNGYEAGATYECKPADGVDIVIIIQNWDIEHKGQEAEFNKTGGINSSVTVISVDATYSQTITEDDKGFKVYTGLEKLMTTQDSRTPEQSTQFDLLTRVIPSAIDPTARLFQVDDFTEIEVESVIITSIDPANPSILSRFIDDDNTVIGSAGKRSANGIGRFKVGGQLDNIQVKFKYSAINKTTLIQTFLSETGWSAPFINDATYSDIVLEGTLPDYEFDDGTAGGSGELFQAEILAIKTNSNRSPTLMVLTGGITPSKAIIGTVGSNLTHPALKQVNIAATGEKQGHIDNSSPYQTPEMTTAEINAWVSPNEGMRVFDTTLGVFKEYLNEAWKIDSKVTANTTEIPVSDGTDLIGYSDFTRGSDGTVSIKSISTGKTTISGINISGDEYSTEVIGTEWNGSMWVATQTTYKPIYKVMGSLGTISNLIGTAIPTNIGDQVVFVTTMDISQEGIITAPEMTVSDITGGTEQTLTTKDYIQAFATLNGLSMPT